MMEGNPLLWMKWQHIEYCIVDGFPDGNYSFDRGSVPMNILVHYEQVYDPGSVAVGSTDAVTMFTGNVDVYTTGLGGRTLLRQMPHPFPPRPWMYALQVNHVRPQGMRTRFNSLDGSLNLGIGNKDDGTLIPYYQQAEIGLLYSMPPYKIKHDADPLVLNDDPESDLYLYPDEGMALEKGYKTNSRYITREIKRQNKMITIPRGLLKDSNGNPILEPIAITENTAIYEYTWWNVPDEGMPEEQWLLGANTVNHKTFDGRPAGTLLFCGEPETRSMPNPITGKRLNTVKYTFHSLILIDEEPPIPEVGPKPLGHNYIRKVVSGKLKPVKFSSDGAGIGTNTVVFRDFDFKKLFRPDPVTP